MILYIGYNDSNDYLNITNIHIFDQYTKISETKMIFQNGNVSIDLLSIDNFDIGDKISVYFEISGRNGKKLMEYSIIVECYKGSEGVKKYRFLY